VRRGGGGSGSGRVDIVHDTGLPLISSRAILDRRRLTVVNVEEHERTVYPLSNAPHPAGVVRVKVAVMTTSLETLETDIILVDVRLHWISLHHHLPNIINTMRERTTRSMNITILNPR
jgi:hypothetical protein